MKRPPSPSDSAATSVRKLSAPKKSTAAPIDSIIHTVRGERVILDADLAKIYGVETRVLNQAVRRNREKFPPDFLLELTSAEASNLQHTRKQDDAILRSQTVILKRGQHLKYQPFAFTEHGALMAANILNSPQAVHEVRQHGEGVVERSGICGEYFTFNPRRVLRHRSEDGPFSPPDHLSLFT